METSTSNTKNQRPANLVVVLEDHISYLGQSKIVTELPKNCLLDKGKVGCGGTSLAISSPDNYVIAVPFVSLIENKVAQHPEIIPLYGAITKEEFKARLRETTTRKVIMTTYDSLEYLNKVIKTSDYRLLVDEYHLLFTQYAFREEAITAVLNNFRSYRDYCFMTATPIEEDFLLEELADLPIVEYHWPNTSLVTVKSVSCPKGVFNSASAVVESFRSGQIEGNLYLFVNSVAFIKELIETLGLTIEECNAIYSKSNRTVLPIARGVLPNSKAGLVPTKRINLLTATVFEGSDIYDPDGKIYIVSDAEKAHTLTDISTSFQQIAGRIRNSRFLDEITHLYSSTRYSDISYAEFKGSVEKETLLAKQMEQEFNNMSSSVRHRLLPTMNFNELYVSKTDAEATIRFNPNLTKLDLYNFKICKHLYQIRVNHLADELESYGYKVEGSVSSTIIAYARRDKASFKEVLESLMTFWEPENTAKEYSEQESVFLQETLAKYPFLEEAVEVLGLEGIKEQNFVITNIKRQLIKNLDSPVQYKVFRMLKTYNDLSAGSLVTGATLKTRFTEIYKELGLKKTAKASDIDTYFHTNPVIKWVDGKSVRSYSLLNPKIILR